MGTGKTHDFLHIIDFGLAKKFRDPRTGCHIPYKQHDSHSVGTALFASLNAHEGIEGSRRDDLESLAYMLIYFMRGTLPWRKLKGSTIDESWSLIHQKKLETSSLLTVGLPSEFDVFYNYVRGLEFGDMPDYEGLRELFRGLAEKHGMEYDGGFDWVTGRNGKKLSIGSGGGGIGPAGGVGGIGGLGKRKRHCRTCDACAAVAAENEANASSTTINIVKERKKEVARWRS